MKLPTAPKQLDAEARKEWKRLIGKLSGLDERDRALLACYCWAWSRILKATMQLEKEELIVDGKPNPLTRIINTSTHTVQTISSKLGLSPFARGQILTNRTIPKESNWGELLSEKDPVKLRNVG